LRQKALLKGIIMQNIIEFFEPFNSLSKEVLSKEEEELISLLYSIKTMNCTEFDIRKIEDRLFEVQKKLYWLGIDIKRELPRA
jgi:hypothetical protein